MGDGIYDADTEPEMVGNKCIKVLQIIFYINGLEYVMLKKIELVN